MLILSTLVKVVGGTKDKEDHNFLETLMVVHPLLGLLLHWGSEQSSQQSTMMRMSGERN